METIFGLAFLLVILLTLGMLEIFIHRQNLRKIPIRIHVNGTRGKSSVTRLIHAALNESGIKTVAKTTGTEPLFLFPEGREVPIYRRLGANIKEQFRVVSMARKCGAKAIVLECMALQPDLQTLSEQKFIQATHGVITNVREDHLDVMGPEEVDVAKALLGMIPAKALLFTAEKDYLKLFSKACQDHKTQLITTNLDQESSLSDQEMDKFPYLEHRENVALVLNICSSLGIERQNALEGMYKVQEDDGVLKETKIQFRGKEIIYLNGFAANDPESSSTLWKIACQRNLGLKKKIIVVNSREDRIDRSERMARAMVEWDNPGLFFLTGKGSNIVAREAMKKGVDRDKIIMAQGNSDQEDFEYLLDCSSDSTLIMGIGNISGFGKMVTYLMSQLQLAQG